MVNSYWQGLQASLDGTAAAPWARSLAALSEKAMADSRHGDLQRWTNALARLPATDGTIELDRPAPILGGPTENPGALAKLLMEFHPWRKGPLRLGGVDIDTEWRSDWKWDRVTPHLGLEGASVLDIGSGNGYFGWRMLGAGARCVVGVDPTLVFVMQWLAQMHFAPGLNNYVLPLRDTDLPPGLGGFDVVFSMGVLYHQREPAVHLRRLASCLRPGGTLVLETLVLDEEGSNCLVPEGRYARMRNVWHIPATQLLVQELAEGQFAEIRVLDISTTTTQEQRSTPWMTFESLGHCLDPIDPARTIEGHPAPVRAVLRATRQ